MTPGRLVHDVSLSLCCLLAFVACASKPAPQPPDPSTEEVNVKNALNSFFEAAERKDWRAIESLLAPEFEFYSDDSLILTREAFLQEMKSDDMDVGKLELRDVRVTLSRDAQMAWVKYRAFMESTRRGGTPYNMESAETVCFRRDSAGWKMTHNHASIRELK